MQVFAVPSKSVWHTKSPMFATMAASISRDSSGKLVNNSCASDSAGFAQPRSCASNLQSDQPRCEVPQTTPLQRDPRRELVSPKDATKRKRVNRIAKLKQCKLDARRVQWLSQSTMSTQDQGIHCRTRQDKQDSQHPQKQEKHKASTHSKAGDIASQNGAECEVVNESFGATNVLEATKNDRFFSGPDLAGGHLHSEKMIKGGEGRLEWLIGTPETESSENKRTPDDTSRSDTEGSRDTIGELQCHGEARGNIRCVASRYLPALHCCCIDNSIQRGSKSLTGRLGFIRGGTVSHDTDAVVVSKTCAQCEDRRNGWRQGCNVHPLSCSSGASLKITNKFESGSQDNNDVLSQESEEDWEVAADALHLTGSKTSQLCEPAPEVTETQGELPGNSESKKGILKPEHKAKTVESFINSKSVGGGRAWRSDDLARPPSLPRLEKQHDFPLESSASVWSGLQQGLTIWGPPRIPSYCPICTEELDRTDTSFFPCSCGFRLCLFCHHRISSDDGRCPGCRQAYCPDVARKLSRTTTFWLRV